MIAHPHAIPPDGRHRYALRVYYEDTDAGGVVYHANYLRYAERARTEALRAVGIPHAEMVERFGVMFMVRRAEVDYLRPARLDDSLVVETEVLAIGGATASLRQAVHGPAGLCADIAVRLACVRIGAGGPAIASAGTEAVAHAGGNRPGRIPPRWRDTLAAMRDAAGHTR